jgi:hypothetical protein
MIQAGLSPNTRNKYVQLGFKLGEVYTLLGRQFLSQCQCQAQEYLAFGKLIQ